MTHVVVVGAHVGSGQSMQRFTRNLTVAYREAGAQVTLLVPAAPVSSRLRGGLRKWVGYVEKFVLFLPALRRAARRADVVHVADHSDALWCLELSPKTRAVVTCHDLIAVRAGLGELPEHRPGATGRLYQRLVLRGLLRASDVIAVSGATAADVARLARRSCAVVPNPLDPAVVRADDSHGSSRAPSFPYLLLVSSRGWRKNREASLRAWVRLADTVPLRDVGLVVVGDPLDERERAIVDGAPRPLPFEHRQRVDDEELAALYAGCRALVFLSRYEGFGWPVVEAAANGRPALLSDIPVFREVAGGAAVHLDVDAMADMEDGDWEATARTLLAVPAGRLAELAATYSWPSFVAGYSQHIGLEGRCATDE